MIYTLTLDKREEIGSRLGPERKAGRLPVVAYGPKEKSTTYYVNSASFAKVYAVAGESSIVNLVVDGKEKPALIHDVALHPVTDKPLHADFYVIEEGKRLEVTVPLEFEGTSPAVKTLGGVLVKVLHELDIEALPASLPHSISVDISKLVTFEDQIHVKDLVLPEGVEVKSEADEVVALVAAPKEEKIEDEGPVDLSTIGTSVEKGKKDEQEVDGSEAGKDK